MPPALLIFDCDGTLVDSEELGTKVLLEMAAELGLRRPLKETNLLFRGWKLDDCVAQIGAWLGRPLPEDFVAQVRVRTAEAFRRELRPVAGAPELVRALAARRQPMCVASSGPREKITLSLTLTGLLPYFEGRIFSGYELMTWKPDPGLFLHAARALGADPAACVVVEDSLVGVQAGLAAGMRVFAFQPEEADAQMPAGAGVIRELGELLAALDQGALPGP
jgi:HAD superfamily hydrolase (TIGR01509 family)